MPQDTAEPANTYNKHFGIKQTSLSLDAELVEDDVPVVSSALLFCQRLVLHLVFLVFP